jgi:hypothetical protein
MARNSENKELANATLERKDVSIFAPLPHRTNGIHLFHLRDHAVVIPDDGVLVELPRRLGN